jgi:hypothetical protein
VPEARALLRAIIACVARCIQFLAILDGSSATRKLSRIVCEVCRHERPQADAARSAYSQTAHETIMLGSFLTSFMSRRSGNDYSQEQQSFQNQP